MPRLQISIPQEVVDHIIDLVARTSSPSRVPDLKSCTLSSRSLRSRTLRYLFSCLDTGMPRFQRIGEWRRFATMVSQSPQVAASYTSLILRHALDFFPQYGFELSATLKSIFSSLVNISHLTVVGPTAGLMKYSIPKYLASMPITWVIMDRATFDTLQDFLDFFGYGLRGTIDSLGLGSVTLATTSTPLTKANMAPPPCTIRGMRLALLEPSIFEAVVNGHLGRLDLRTLFFKGIPHPAMFHKLFSGMPLRELTLVIEPWRSEIPPLACGLPHLVLLHIDIAQVEWLSSAISAGHIGGSLTTLTLSATDANFRIATDLTNLDRLNTVMSDKAKQLPWLTEIGLECYDHDHRSLELLVRRDLKVLSVKWMIRPTRRLAPFP